MLSVSLCSREYIRVIFLGGENHSGKGGRESDVFTPRKIGIYHRPFFFVDSETQPVNDVLENKNQE